MNTSTWTAQFTIRAMRTDSGRQVVISGMSGVFPDANNVYELRDKLFAGEDLVTDDERRWIAEHPEVPQRTGKLSDLRHFDASFFGVTSKQGQAMDPMCRNLLERAYEAVADAGANPRQLRGMNVGVFVAAAISESEKTWFYDKLQANGMGLTGCSRAMFANRISYWLGTHGPSYLMDTGCSSGLSALEHAYRALQDGTCDSAIVGAANLCLHPYVSLQFSRLGVLSPEGKCRCFDNDAYPQQTQTFCDNHLYGMYEYVTIVVYKESDEDVSLKLYELLFSEVLIVRHIYGLISLDSEQVPSDGFYRFIICRQTLVCCAANGFARSEAVVVMYLQWASEAHRVYATIEHMRCSFEGFRSEFAREPSLPMQEQLLREFYAESGHDPRTVEYLEASAHGIRSWDATELEAVSRVFCQDRDTPLRIGCVKSNMGHTEPVSGLCGLAKVLIAMETGCIPPNLHYNNPNEAVDALKQGQLEAMGRKKKLHYMFCSSVLNWTLMLQVVTEKCAFNGGLVAVNSFSLAGSGVHLLLRWNDKVKVNNGAPTDRIPRLVIASGRTEEAVDYILKELESKPLDAEFVQLIQDLHSTDIPGHTYRGYSVITQDDKRLRSVKASTPCLRLNF
ncbi:hypothetical protein ANN_00088 [Periplaneta americana]|uniref:Ketosynthase family 3 (KS3) domain-containing protein n=1 Tax=Periplaneta americana TaxID=6978 RepID=A0ABQ8TS67_PERAM|nr:hypothetical protein ANN_00088 [Periplaneta americana]